LGGDLLGDALGGQQVLAAADLAPDPLDRGEGDGRDQYARHGPADGQEGGSPGPGTAAVGTQAEAAPSGNLGLGFGARGHAAHRAYFFCHLIILGRLSWMRS
jgi:hypothetical protein